MAACAPVPILNVVCEAVGSVVEAGYQSVAAIEGAKAAVETVRGATAAQKGRAEMILATGAHEEETSLASLAGQLHMKSEEESATAASEELVGEAMISEANEAELLSEKMAGQSEEDEAMAAIAEDVSNRNTLRGVFDMVCSISYHELTKSFRWFAWPEGSGAKGPGSSGRGRCCGGRVIGSRESNKV
jgi:hypothetical protein